MTLPGPLLDAAAIANPVPYAAVIAAAVTGAFTLLQLVISKESKVSELQQAELDGLRGDLSKYVAAVSYLSQLNARGDTSSATYVELARSAFDTAATAQACLLMRLGANPNDSPSKTLAESILSVRGLLAAEKYDDAKSKAFELVDLAQPVLDGLSKRIAVGQPFFLFTRALFLGVFLLSLGFLVLAGCAWLTQ